MAAYCSYRQVKREAVYEQELKNDYTKLERIVRINRRKSRRYAR